MTSWFRAVALFSRKAFARARPSPFSRSYGAGVDECEEADEWFVSVFVHEQRGGGVWSFGEHECGTTTEQLDGAGRSGGDFAGAVSVYGCTGDEWAEEVLLCAGAVKFYRRKPRERRD